MASNSLSISEYSSCILLRSLEITNGSDMTASLPFISAICLERLSVAVLAEAKALPSLAASEFPSVRFKSEMADSSSFSCLSLASSYAEREADSRSSAVAHSSSRM